MKRWIVFSILLIFFILVVVLNLTRARRNLKEVEVVSTRLGKIEEVITAQGVLKANSHIQVSSDIMGKIIEIRVRENDSVRRGDILVRLDPTTYQIQLNQAKLRLKQNLLRFEKLKEDFKRVESLYTKGLVSRSEYEETYLNYESLRTQIQIDSEYVKEVEVSLMKTIIRSPVEGVVLKVYRSVGEYVVPGTTSNPGTVIMEIADLTGFVAEVNVDETEMVKIRKGQNALVYVDAYPDSVFEGVVTRYEGIPKSLTGLDMAKGGATYPVIIELRKKGGFIPGLSVKCDIVVERKDSVLVVPISALGKKKIGNEEKDVVIKVQGGVVRIIPVKLGIFSMKEVEVVEGLSLGDTICIGPYKVLDSLKDGERVRIRWSKEKI